ncbi:MAG: hypothetical protein WCG62_06610 [Actinomycetes bacterium]
MSLRLVLHTPLPEEESAAVVAALHALVTEVIAESVASQEADTSWRFSGRWFAGATLLNKRTI